MSDLYIKPRTGPNARIVAYIDDSADGDGGPSLLVMSGIVTSASVHTKLKISSISAGRLRFNIAGAPGTWRSTAGVYEQTIEAGSGNYVAIEFDPFTVAEIELSECTAETA